MFINALDKQNAGMGWDKASYLLTTTSPASTLVIMSTTKGRSGLAVADFKLYNVTGLPNGGLAAPTIQPMPNTAADSKEPAPSTTTPTGSRGRHGHGASVLFALVSVAILISVGVMVLGGNDAWGSGNLLAALPTFWRRSEDGYGVLGFAHGGGNAAAGEGGYQASSSSYQRAAAAVELGRWSGGGGGSGGGGKGKGGRRGGDNEGDGNSSDDEEVMFTQPRREKGKGESKRDDGEWGRRKHEV